MVAQNLLTCWLNRNCWRRMQQLRVSLRTSFRRGRSWWKGTPLGTSTADTKTAKSILCENLSMSMRLAMPPMLCPTNTTCNTANHSTSSTSSELISTSVLYFFVLETRWQTRICILIQLVHQNCSGGGWASWLPFHLERAPEEIGRSPEQVCGTPPRWWCCLGRRGWCQPLSCPWRSLCDPPSEAGLPGGTTPMSHGTHREWAQSGAHTATHAAAMFTNEITSSTI